MISSSSNCVVHSVLDFYSSVLRPKIVFFPHLFCVLFKIHHPDEHLLDLQMMLKAPQPGSSDESFAFVHLDRLFVYQNNITGQVSTTRLTLRQLCRILCPSSSHQHTPKIRHLTADTNILLQELDGTYSSDGWKPARSVPVLQQVVSLWYYYIQPITAISSKSETPDISPPVSVRSLISVARKCAASTSEVIFVSSALTDSNWRRLSELPYLQLALQAFDNDAVKNDPLERTSASHAQATSLPENDTSDIQLELEAFLNATHTASAQKRIYDSDDEDEETYDSDGGTRYIKDHRTGNWVHEALIASTSSAPKDSGAVFELKQATANSKIGLPNPETVKKQSKKKAKFAAKNSRCWIYITGLPNDCTEKEIAERFSKAGLLDLDPQTQLPKVKLYRYKEGDANATTAMVGQPKGDASICYARPESVSLAVTLFDGAPFRVSTIPNQDAVMSVQAAKFEQHGSEFDAERNRLMMISNAQRKIAKLATKQAVDWDEGEYNGRLTGGRKGLRIIVLKHSFDPYQVKLLSSEADQDAFFGTLEEELRMECEQFGVVEKITFFASNPEGITVVKFTQPGSASDAVFRFNGSSWKGRAIEACFWDGVTDYTLKEDETKEAKDMEIREEEFGSWLESQELPDELRLQTD
jgi:RNA recognition motif-containing protein